MLLQPDNHIYLKLNQTNLKVVREIGQEKIILQEFLQINNKEKYTYQTMLLENDTSTEVEIHEAKEVDFGRIQEHLRRGGSVFITSKHSQKLPMPNTPRRRLHSKRKAARTVTALFLDHV